ncbi:MAG: M48 family metallopeptidase [Rariglobus sp.]
MIIRESKRRMEIRRLEALAKKRPDEFRVGHRAAVLKAFRWLVLCLALPVSTTLAGVVGLLWIEGYALLDWSLVIAGGFVTVAVARCLVVRLPEDGALQMDRGTHALLFRDINEIRQRIDAPKFARIEFNMELNAAVAQRPRWLGLLGSSSTLYIGFPLIFCLSRNEFKTVLAHEIAHISRKHNLSRRWILQVQISIINVYQYFSGGRSGVVGRCLESWLGGFMPALIDHGLVAGRMHEREADRLAAEAGGVEACSKALAKIAVLGALYEEDFRESLEDRVRKSDYPSVRFIDEFLKHVEAATKNPAKVRELLAIELARASELTSSHPSLGERLANIGGTAPAEVELRGGAAEEYFGRGYKGLIEEIDRRWLSAIMPSWSQRHRNYRQMEARLQKINNLQDEGEKLHGYELLNIAALTEELYGRNHALTAYAEYHTKFPHTIEGRFHYGRLLLANKDERGIQVMSAVVAQSPVYREDGLLVMKAFYQRKQNAEGARWCDAQLEAFYLEMKPVLEDRFEHAKNAVFHTHGLPTDFQESLYRLCGAFPGIQQLHLLRKEVKFFAESPFHVIVVSFNGRAGFDEDRARLMDMIRNFVELPGDCMVVDGLRHAAFRGRLKAKEFDAAKIYDRTDG